MIYASLKLIHVLSIVLWIGGMFFAHAFLRPSVQFLEPPLRIRLMHDVLKRFFTTVQVVVLLVLFSGLWMIGRVAKETVQAGLPFNMPLGILMIVVFGHIRFALFKRLSRAVSASDWPAGGAALASIRTWVGVNLILGVATIAATLLLG